MSFTFFIGLELMGPSQNGKGKIERDKMHIF